MEMTIALASTPRPDVVRHDVFGNLLQTVFAGDEVVLAGELPLQLGLLVVVQDRRFHNLGDVLAEVLVHQLEFGDAVLVVERDGVAVIDGLLEVVDRRRNRRRPASSVPPRPSAAFR